MSVEQPTGQNFMPNDADDQLPDAGLDPVLAAILPRQAAFVLAFLDTGNSAEAARVAGYNCPNAHQAAVNGSRLLTEPSIKKAVASLREQRWSEAHASRTERLALLSAIGRGLAINGGPQPTYSERIAALKLTAQMSAELSPKTAITVNTPQYIVPMPPRISDPDEWSKMALATMKTIDAQHERLPPGPAP